MSLLCSGCGNLIIKMDGKWVAAVRNEEGKWEIVAEEIRKNGRSKWVELKKRPKKGVEANEKIFFKHFCEKEHLNKFEESFYPPFISDLYRKQKKNSVLNT